VKGSITTAKVSVPSADDVPVRTSARYRTGEKADSKLLQSKRDCEFFSIVQISLQLRAVPSRVSWGRPAPSRRASRLFQNSDYNQWSLFVAEIGRHLPSILSKIQFLID